MNHKKELLRSLWVGKQKVGAVGQDDDASCHTGALAPGLPEPPRYLLYRALRALAHYIVGTSGVRGWLNKTTRCQVPEYSKVKALRILRIAHRLNLAST